MFLGCLQMRMSMWARELSAQAAACARGKEEEGCAIRRRRELRKVDRELEKRNYKAAISLVKQLQGKPRGLRGFGAVKLVPGRMSSMEELKLSNFDTAGDIAAKRSLIDLVLHSIKCCRKFALEEEEEALSSGVDNSVSSGADNSVDGESYDCPSKDHQMCLQHEAGHFLVGYLLGVLPKRYRIPSVEDLMQDEFAGGKVEFLGFEFLTEISNTVTSNKKSIKSKPGNEVFLAWPPSHCLRLLLLEKQLTYTPLIDIVRNKALLKTISRFLCVILGGLVAEHLQFGFSELLHSDVNKMDGVLKWLGFTKDEANFRVRHAALNTITILSQHHQARSRLAEAMATGRSIGICIDTVENTLDKK